MSVWSELKALLRGGSLTQEAFSEAIVMLRESHGMYRDAIASLHKEGAMAADIYERDRQVNRYERDVRRKIVTHMSVSTRPDVNMGLVLTAIIIDIERIGDYTKNIVELAMGLEAPFDGLELQGDVVEMERAVTGMFEDTITALENSDEASARQVMETHKRVSETAERDMRRLRNGEVLTGRSGHAVTVALHLRFLKRVSAHLKNVATSVVNPYYRIGFREKHPES